MGGGGRIPFFSGEGGIQQDDAMALPVHGDL